MAHRPRQARSASAQRQAPSPPASSGRAEPATREAARRAGNRIEDCHVSDDDAGAQRRQPARIGGLLRVWYVMRMRLSALTRAMRASASRFDLPRACTEHARRRCFAAWRVEHGGCSQRGPTAGNDGQGGHCGYESAATEASRSRPRRGRGAPETAAPSQRHDVVGHAAGLAGGQRARCVRGGVAEHAGGARACCCQGERRVAAHACCAGGRARELGERGQHARAERVRCAR